MGNLTWARGPRPWEPHLLSGAFLRRLRAGFLFSGGLVRLLRASLADVLLE